MNLQLLFCTLIIHIIDINIIFFTLVMPINSVKELYMKVRISEPYFESKNDIF